MDDGVVEGLIDLFGNPVRVVRRGRGRPSHVASLENRSKVMLWLVMGRDDVEIAGALGVTTRTLAKHYFHELAYRRTARMEMEALNLSAIIDQVRGGNVSAMSLLAKRLERLGLEAQAARHQVREPKAPAQQPVGLKAQRRAAAGRIEGLFAPRMAPGRVN